MVKFAIYKGETLDREVEVTEQGALIGRADRNDVVLADPSKSVSRVHAQLKYEDGKLTIVDLNSQNGTWVRGKRVRRAVLNPGDEVVMGSFRLVWLSIAAVPFSDGIRVDETRTVETPGRSVDTPPGGGATAAKPVASAAAAERVGIEKRGSPGATSPVPEPQTGRARGTPPKPVVRAAGRRKIPGGVLAAAALIVLVAAVYALFFTNTGRSMLGFARVATERKAAEVGQKAADHAPAPGASPPAAAAPEAQLPAAPPAGEPANAAAPVSPQPPEAEAAAAKSAGQNAAQKTEPAGGQITPAEARRLKSLQDRYTRAKAALSKGDFGDAIAGFEAVVAEQPKYLDASKLLQVARAQDAARREQEIAKRAYDAGLQAEAGGNDLVAVQHFEQALKSDPSLADAQEALRRVRERMRVEGEDAYKRAKQYDALGRTADAIGMYEKAVQLLPANHQLRANARERLEALRAIK